MYCTLYSPQRRDKDERFAGLAVPAIARADLEERRDELGSDCAVTDQRAGHRFWCLLFFLIQALQGLHASVKMP